MRQTNRCSGGFTLIELMVAVALIGVLAATAMASFQLYQLRSKRSEALVNLASLRKTQLAYFHEAGGFIPASPSPAIAVPGRDKQNWPAGGGLFPSDPPGSGFHLLGWQPEGPTFFDYDTNAVNNGPNGPCFTAAAYGDTDGDGFLSVFLYVHPDSVGNTLPSGILGLQVPFDPHTCTPHLNMVAQVPAVAGCGFPNADDY